MTTLSPTDSFSSFAEALVFMSKKNVEKSVSRAAEKRNIKPFEQNVNHAFTHVTQVSTYSNDTSAG